MVQIAGRRCLLRLLTAAFELLGLLAAVTPVMAQRAEPPRLALDFRGPAGRTRAVGFAGDGRRFHAAGENKLVQF
ncbi:MAG: hypothetical protein ACK5X8_19090, partial [Planctomyces sp.]